MKKVEELFEILRLDRKNSAYSRAHGFQERFEEFLSEVDEIKEEIEKEDYDALKGELGDALSDLFFMFIIGEEKGYWKSDDILESSIKKFKRRKPWIFSENDLSVLEEIKRWKQAKEKEKVLKNKQK